MSRTSVVALVLVAVAAVLAGVFVARRTAGRRGATHAADCAIGIEVTGLSEAWRTRLGVPVGVTGAVITEVLPGGPASKAGLRPGDVISADGAAPVTTACTTGFAVRQSCEPFDVTVHHGSAVTRVPVAPTDAAALYERACRQGRQSACYRLGWLAWSGGGAARDQLRAEQLYDRACRAGGGAACGELGRLWSSRADRRAEALSLLERACDLDDPEGCLLLASAFATGTLAPRDDARATPVYEKACALGSAVGCYNTGLMYNDGRGVPADPVRAFRAYAEGCAMGSTTACSDEGYMHQHGRAVAQDGALAAALYERACAGTPCQARNLLGCLNLGRTYRDGIGVVSDPARAAEIFRSICEGPVDERDVNPGAQRARACSLLGALHLAGRGVPADPGEGLELSKRGCDQGDGFGCYKAGVVLEPGLGVEPDREQAMACFRRACGAGDEESCDYILRKLPEAGAGREVRTTDGSR
jgi:TPR repeat protein